MSDDDVEVASFSFGEHGYLLPPPEGVCQQCARDHEPEQAHDAGSLHYQYWFFRQRGRWPNWGDALAHCPPEISEVWRDRLKQLGVDDDRLEERP